MTFFQRAMMEEEIAVMKQDTTKEIQLVVPRMSHAGSVEAALSVHATVDGDFNDEGDYPDSMALQGHITAAVTQWINETAAGRAAWEQSAEDFTIVDLRSHLEDQELVARLALWGIRSLLVEYITCDESDWEMDEPLVDVDDLDLEEE
jgi:hypothetical protein